MFEGVHIEFLASFLLSQDLFCFTHQATTELTVPFCPEGFEQDHKVDTLSVTSSMRGLVDIFNTEGTRMHNGDTACLEFYSGSAFKEMIVW